MMKEDYQSSIKEIFEEFIGSKVTESKKMVSEQTKIGRASCRERV